jgi:hypothetical protein
MKSVPPRGSGWIDTLPIAICRLPIGVIGGGSIGNWQLEIGNVQIHPLPRGGTDFMTLRSEF